MGKCLVCVALLALACSQKEQAKPKPTSQQDAPSHSSQPIAPAPATPPPAAAQTESSANAEEIFAALERFKDEMCACEDAKCAEGVSDGKMRWLQTKARRAGYPAKLTAEEGARADAIDEAIRKCEETAFDAVPPRKK